MDLALSDEQRELVASFANLLAKESSPEQVRAAEPGGFDPDLWRTLRRHRRRDDGAWPRTDGGWGASLLDLALVAELVGRAAAPAPVIEAQVAARLLAAVGSPPPSTPSSRCSRASSSSPSPLRPPAPAWPSSSRPARSATPSSCSTATACCSCRSPTPTGRPVANLGLRAARRRRASADGTILGWRRRRRRARSRRRIDEWLVLTAAALVGIGTRRPRARRAPTPSSAGPSACRSAPSRAISHPLADDATALDGARLLVQQGGVGARPRRPRGRELAAMAFAFASEAAETATYDALHIHGGYGFMLEYDVQLHYRRARGWARVWGDAEAGYRRAADARYAHGREALMDFDWDAETEALPRARCGAFLAEHLTARARGPALRARASPTTTASPARSASGTGSPPTGSARASRPLGARGDARPRARSLTRAEAPDLRRCRPR